MNTPTHNRLFHNCLRCARRYERSGHQVQAEYWYGRMEVYRSLMLSEAK